MIAAASTLLGANGEPIAKPASPRNELRDMPAVSDPLRSRRRAHASYDAAANGDAMAAYWANADALDADNGNNRAVRHRLAHRSRYEVGSNGYYAGILRTHCNMIVGVGPKLRMLTKSTAFNQAVELAWSEWSEQIKLRRKLWAMCHAKNSDGDGFAVLIENNGLAGRVALDLLLIETEQCQTPYLSPSVKGYIDGIRFDGSGNPIWYDILPEHPGSQFYFAQRDPVQVPASQVLHWFKMRRPGQHRGIPEMTPTLNLGANGRRFREATIGAAELAASFAAMLSTQANANGSADEVAEMSTLPINHRMMTALPMGWQMQQLKAEHPTATYSDFNRQLVSEQARPISQPYNAAACDSSTYSFASGKLDTLCYRAEIDIERADANDLVLDPLFALFFAEWTIGLADRESFTPPHQWDWPAHPVIDVVAEAEAVDKRLKNGTTTLRRVYADSGMDFEDELQAMAEDYGVSVDEMRDILLRTNLPAAQSAKQPMDAGDQPLDQMDEQNNLQTAGAA